MEGFCFWLVMIISKHDIKSTKFVSVQLMQIHVFTDFIDTPTCFVGLIVIC